MDNLKTILFSLSLALLLTACSNIKPWVKPYEKAFLADEIMILDRDPVASSYFEHVYDTREGSRGAGLAAGGGCGCN
jgi:Domain of unknown function (DUF4266)